MCAGLIKQKHNDFTGVDWQFAFREQEGKGYNVYHVYAGIADPNQRGQGIKINHFIISHISFSPYYLT